MSTPLDRFRSAQYTHLHVLRKLKHHCLHILLDCPLPAVFDTVEQIVVNHMLNINFVSFFGFYGQPLSIVIQGYSKNG